MSKDNVQIFYSEFGWGKQTQVLDVEEIVVQTEDSGIESGETQVMDFVEIAVQTQDSGIESGETQVMDFEEIVVQTQNSGTESGETQVLNLEEIAVQTQDSAMESGETQVMIHTKDAQTKPCTNNTNETKPKLQCEICRREYSNLNRHMRKRHPEHCVYRVKPKFLCTYCSASYQHLSVLSKHLKKAHDECEAPVIKVNPEYNYPCNICGNFYATGSSLRKHTREKHKLELPTVKSKCFKCSECDSSFNIKSSYFDHITTVHDIYVNSETLQFENEEDFKAWKLEVEKNTMSRYRITSTFRNLTRYNCHRNGFFVSRNTGKRRLKTGGSIKINCYCPASIFVKTKNQNNTFPAEVEFISTHLGHVCETVKSKWKPRRKCKQETENLVTGFANKLEEFSDKDKNSEIDRAIAMLMALKKDNEPNSNPGPQKSPAKRQKKATNV